MFATVLPVRRIRGVCSVTERLHSTVERFAYLKCAVLSMRCGEVVPGVPGAKEYMTAGCDSWSPDRMISVDYNLNALLFFRKAGGFDGTGVAPMNLMQKFLP
eukprot:498925-Pleurochrysis_carterae.AAC.3